MAFSAWFSDIGPDSAVFEAEFTGGDANYANYRYVMLEYSCEYWNRRVMVVSQQAGGSNSSFSETITSLEPHTIYEWTATLGWVDNDGNNHLTEITDSGSFTTEYYPVPENPHYDKKIQNITSTSAELYYILYNFDPNFIGDRYIEFVIDGVGSWRNLCVNLFGNAFGLVEATGLEPNTTYTFSASFGYDDRDGVYHATDSFSGTFRTLYAKLDMEPWSWEHSNGEATTAMTQNAYQILMGNAPADGFSHYVWNDFVDKVYQMRTLTDGQWDLGGGDYLGYQSCKVNAGDHLSAAQYNSIKYQIGSISPTDIADVSPGDKLTGYHIIHLADVLNKIIGA